MQVTQRELINAFASGARFVLVLSDHSTRFVFNRSEVDRAKKGGTLREIFYLLPDGNLRPCARGKRLAK